MGELSFDFFIRILNLRPDFMNSFKNFEEDFYVNS
jgi:hypothetical protein